MDRGRAVSQFLDRVDSYGQIILVSTEEVADLFGEELMLVLEQFESFAREQQLCADCGGQCCDDIGCELFAPQFGQCPIHSFRPIACRLHFCRKFDVPYKSMVIELRDVFFNCYKAIDTCRSPNIASLDTPPFAAHCPELVTLVAPLVEAVRQGKSAPQDVADLMMEKVSRYRLSRTGRPSGISAH